ncbi:MAG: ATP-binding protein [Kiritimatiellales bacterium]
MHATLCDLITDIVQNSVEADASEIELTVREDAEMMEFEVKDNGRGMNSETQAKAIDPFYSDGRKHPHRKVGLGLPFLFQTAEASGGSAAMESEAGTGTAVYFRAQAQHVDLPPFGDFSGAAAMMLSGMNSGELKIHREVAGKSYSLSRLELDEAMGGLQTAGNLNLLKTYIASHEEELTKKESFVRNNAVEKPELFSK